MSEQHFQPGSEMKGLLSTVKKRVRSSKVMKTKCVRADDFFDKIVVTLVAL